MCGLKTKKLTSESGIRKFNDLRKTHGGDWRKVIKELDERSWEEVIETLSSGINEKKFDTYIPGRIFYLYDLGEKCRGIREVACDAPVIRFTVVSSTMVSDHDVELYESRLDRYACDDVKDEEVNQSE